MLKINHLRIDLADICLFKDINLSVDQGQIIRLVGDNGSGKSTLLNLIYGLQKPSRGSISYQSQIKMNYLPQIEEAYPKMYLQLKDVCHKTTPFYSKDLHEKNWHTASGGEKKKTLLSRILLSKDDLILLDEPFNHLDLKTMESLEAYILNMSENGHTFIYTGHQYKIKDTIDYEIDKWK